MRNNNTFLQWGSNDPPLTPAQEHFLDDYDWQGDYNTMSKKTQDEYDAHRTACIEAIRRMNVGRGEASHHADDYILEAEHQDGEYWNMMHTPDEAAEDYVIYMENSD